MKLVDLLNKANKYYPDSFLSEYYTADGSLDETLKFGDGLAKFIVTEIIETFDPEATETTSIQVAVQALNRAIEDLNSVIRGLEEDS